MKGTFVHIKVALAALIVFSASAALAATPKESIRDTLERVLAITRTFESQQDFIDNKPKLRAIILPRFDFREMARRSLGPDWDRLQGREDEFVAAFIQFAEASYTNALGSYRGEKMNYGREKIDNDAAEVYTEVVGSNGDVTPIVYKMRLAGGDWKVYDVVIDDVSIVSNFGSQFARILKKDSLDGLMAKLRAKAQVASS
ncbi:MAG TPA: ABC transporter substrate-binding protein [Candidatus Binatia bacterium]|nr:ABC transporter substrate-binding protein [Candidatus Binatia bacterium]